MPHLFHKRDRENGQLSVCPDRVKTFSQLLKDKIDTDGDGRISKGEFIRGYCIWQMHIKKAAMHQVQKGGGETGGERQKRNLSGYAEDTRRNVLAVNNETFWFSLVQFN